MLRLCAAAPLRKASLGLAFLLGAVRAVAEAPLPAPADSFHAVRLPGSGGATLQALVRGPRVPPLRYRVVVLPGSGCAGMGAFAERYFAGLLHAQVLVLHKPGVDPQALTPPGACPTDFVQHDALAAWQAHALAALRAAAGSELPTVLVGISEGAELLPGLAPAVPQLAGLVLLASSGLDPREAGALQAQRMGHGEDWQRLQTLQADVAVSDHTWAQGRSLRYWRDLWAWPLAQPLIDGPWPLWQVWGQADALVPPEAYARFGARAQGRPAPWCARSLPGADHGLQAPGDDGVQRVWAWLEQGARQGRLLRDCP